MGRGEANRKNGFGAAMMGKPSKNGCGTKAKYLLRCNTMKNSSVETKLDRIESLVKSIAAKIRHLGHDAETRNDCPPDSKPQIGKHQKGNTSGFFARAKNIWFWLRDTAFASLTSYAWALVVGLLTLYGGVGTYVALRYDVSVVPTFTLDTRDAYETRFIITNQGPFGIRDFTYICAFIPVQSGEEANYRIFSTLVPSPPSSLRPHGYASAYCGSSPQLPKPLQAGTMLEIDIMYPPRFVGGKVKMQGGELFVLKYDQAGNAVWIPLGDSLLYNEEKLRDLSRANFSRFSPAK